MKLAFIALDRLSVSKANMRHAKAPPDVSDILPTIRKRGVIQSLLQAYAAAYAETYQVQEPVTELISAMPDAFLDSDREFTRTHKSR